MNHVSASCQAAILVVFTMKKKSQIKIGQRKIFVGESEFDTSKKKKKHDEPPGTSGPSS
jgi:hypothetical protein